jgi:hypothetical protein
MSRQPRASGRLPPLARSQPSFPQPGVVDCPCLMSDGNGNQGTIGVIHIECRKHGGEPSEYLVSFGGNSAGVFYLARASGFDPLTALLRKLGVPGPALRTALQVLEIEQRHKIPNMTLTQDHFRELGL